MRSFGCLAAILLIVSTVDAQTISIAELTARLGDRDYSVRESAQAELLRGDPAVLPLLELTMRTETNPEIRERVETILAELKKRGERSRFLKAEPIALRFQATPLKTAVAEVRKLARIAVELAPSVKDANRPITLDTGPLPIWEAVERFRAAAGLEEVFQVEPALPASNTGNGFGNGRNFLVYPQSTPAVAPTPIVWIDARTPTVASSADRSGMLRVTALPARFPIHRRIRGEGMTVLYLDVTAPQHFAWSESGPVRIDYAEDQSGRPLTAAALPSPPPPTNGFENIVFLNNGMMMNLGESTSRYGAVGPKPANPRYAAVPVRTDDRSTSSLRVLQGSLRGEVTIPDEAILTIDDLSAVVGKVYQLGVDATFVVVDLKTSAEGTRTMKIKITAPNPWNLARRGILGRRGIPASLWDDGGFGSSSLKSYRFSDDQNRKATGVVFSTSSSDNGIQQTSELEIRFDRSMTAGPPKKLVILGDRIVPLEVPFRLTNVPMP